MTLPRSGHSSSYFAMGLFLLSCLIVLPALKWTFEKGETQEKTASEYTFAGADLEPQLLEGSETGPGKAEVAGNEPLLKIKQWHWLDGWDEKVAQFESVFWEPDDTSTLRSWLSEHETVAQSEILEIGTGTGLVSLHWLKLGAARVVATDINEAAVANAKYNADLQGIATDVFDVRQVPSETPQPFAVIEKNERYDFVISNPPWEDDEVTEPAEYALYDPQFSLLDAILEQANSYLKPGGKLLLAYGAKTAIERIQSRAPENGWQVEIADSRDLSSVPEVFLPGVLLVLSRAQ